MDNVTSAMRDMIMEWGRGRIFFLSDFAELNNPGAVRFALMSMARQGYVTRLARGVYCYPKIEGDDIRRVIIPSAQTIAYAIASREKVRIQEYGHEAAFRLGLSGYNRTELKYLTDGAPRKITLWDETKIYFNHTDEVKIFSYRNQTMQELVSAIRFLGEELLSEDKRSRIREILRDIPERDFLIDIEIPPAWVGKILLDQWER